jgi:hypothetical protein
MEKVIVRASYKVFGGVDFKNALVAGDLQGRFGQHLKPCQISYLNRIIVIIMT